MKVDYAYALSVIIVCYRIAVKMSESIDAEEYDCRCREGGVAGQLNSVFDI